MRNLYSSLTFGFIFLTFAGFAQGIQWNAAPATGFVFQITNKEAEKLLTRSKPDTIFHGLLHTQVDTFTVSKGWTNRPAKGHFILARIVQNTLQCEYMSVFPYQVFLLKEYNALSLQVLDSAGNVREDAIVKLKRRRLRMDSSSKTYRIENEWVKSGNSIVTVELEGFRSVFNVQKVEAPIWDNYYNNYDEGPDFYSYLITDKNKYKPGERVRFKSYALSNGRMPLRRKLEAWVVGMGKNIRVGQVEPHRPGSFASEFVLHDSLKLILDQYYTLQLRDRNGRIVSNGSFKYEDYELHRNLLKVELRTQQQFHPASNEIIVDATDVNGLRLKDMKATVVVRTESIREIFQPVVTLPDTLLYKTLNLETNESTVIEIPSSLFQKSNTVYHVDVAVVNSENHRMEQRVSAIHSFSQYELTTRFSNDSIVYELRKNGEVVPNSVVTMYRNNDRNGEHVILPFKEKINPALNSVRLTNESVSRTILFRELLPKLELIGGIQKDSFNIMLANPQKLEVSWYVYQGNLLLEKGFGTELEYNSVIADRSQTYYVELLYSFGGQEKLVHRQFVFRESFLDVSLQVPDRVYPGQQVEALIQVTNEAGIPISGVDLTAMATTAKLNYYLPDLPYYGDRSIPRSEGANFTKHTLDKRVAKLSLDYQIWAKRARLDTMKYYQFTYPNGQFVHTSRCEDSTQFAPYVMQNGMATKIFVIEVNRKPVYYSWTNQPKGYSFYVNPGRRTEVTLRLQDRVLILDSLVFKRGTKTIISIDLDRLPARVGVNKLMSNFVAQGRKRKKVVYWTLTSTEVNRHRQYIAAFTSGDRTAYLEGYNEFTPLYHRYNRYAFRVIAGPISPDFQTYQDDRYTRTHYRHMGGFAYEFEGNIVYKLAASDLIPTTLESGSYDPMVTINDRVVTKDRFLQKPQQEKERWHPSSIDLVDHAVHIRLALPEEEEKTGVAAVLFEHSTTGEIVSPCRYSYSRYDFNAIPRGGYQVIVLYHSGAYLKMSDLSLKSNTKIVADMNAASRHASDSASQVWLQTLANNCYRPVSPMQTRSFAINYFDKKTGNVQGVINDDINQPIPGVNVVEKNTVNGTITDAHGRFALDITQQNSTLVISFIGYKTQEIEVRPGSQVVVAMEADVTQLSEVIVTGYGMRSERKNLTAAVSSVLQGKIAGVVLDSDGEYEGTPNESELGEDAALQEAEKRLYQELLTLQTIRSNFSDIGFWEPKLFTDRKGQSKFTIKFPDDITRWDATVYAMNRRLQTGTVRKSIRSYKPIMAELHVPNFLTVGDSANFKGKVLNYSDVKNIKGKVKWEGAGSSFEKPVDFADYHTEKLPLYASMEDDSLTTSYQFIRDDGYLDGEKRSIPVIPQGIIRADGALAVLKNHEEVHLKAGPNETVHVQILDNQLDLYSGEVRYLLEYKYACNEQLASKLMGLIQHKLLMQYEERKFDYDKDVNKIIERLLKNQNEEFLWSWWDISPNTSYWMSAHILRALKMAKDAGYKVPLKLDNVVRKATYKFDHLGNFSPYDADLLQALAVWGAELDYARYIPQIDSLIQRTEQSYRNWWYKYSLLKEKFLLLETRQLRQIPFERDSLLRYKKETITGEINFTDRKPSYSWYGNEMAANAIAYRIVSRDSLLRQLTTPMQLYFLSERRRGSWNTYHSANVLMSILPDLLAAGVRKNKVATVELRGKVNLKIEKFPYTVTLRKGEELHILRETGLPLYYMQYKEERVTQAKKGGDGFEIKTSFSENILKAGKPVVLKVEVDVEKDATFEYVMIDVPIPGACSYADKRQNDNYIETHREYFKDRTAIFCENMKAGKHIFQIQLLPRFTGKYVVNPAEVLLMYIPVINANTDMSKVTVTD